MSANSKYFLIPFHQVPKSPTYTVWYATWSRDPPAGVPPGTTPPMVVGCTEEDRLPTGAVALVSGGKDPLPPPPPPPPLLTTVAEYQKSYAAWLSGRIEDE